MTKITKSVSEFFREKLLRNSALVAVFFILGSMSLNAALPKSFVHVISYEGKSYTSVIKVSNSILETTWTLIDANNLIPKLTGSKVLGANLVLLKLFNALKKTKLN